MSDLFQRIILLKQAPIFADVDLEDLRLVAQILDEEPCFRGELIFAVNDPSDRMYIIQSGKVGISKLPRPAEKDVKVVFGPKDCFGEMGMFNDSPRSASALVLEDGMLLSLEKEKLHTVILRHPALALGLLATLSIRLRDVSLGVGMVNTEVTDDPLTGTGKTR